MSKGPAATLANVVAADAASSQDELSLGGSAPVRPSRPAQASQLDLRRPGGGAQEALRVRGPGLPQAYMG